MERSTPSPVTLIGGAIAGAIPFVVSNARGGYSVVNGEVVDAVYRDWIAIGGGIAAVILGLATLAMYARSKKGFAVAGVAIAALGGYHIARGLGAFWKPPVEDRFADPRDSFGDMPPSERTAKPPPAASADPSSCPTQDECDNLAAQLKKTDVKAARIAIARSCDFGAGYACEEAAEAWLKEDPARARAFYDKACSMKREAACNELGVIYLQGQGVEKDLAKGNTYLEKACTYGQALGCKNLAIVYRDGIGVTADVAKAAGYAIKSCAIDSWMTGDADAVAYGCNYAGNAYLNGDGVKADKKLAVEQYTRACNRSRKYCFNLAASFYEGLVEKDLERARELFGVACEAGSHDACNNLGDMLNRGEGGAKDKPQAKALFQKACDAGLDVACTNLKKMK